MSAIPTGEILEAVNRGEASLPALKRATGFDYPVLLTALEGELSMEVRREETVEGFLRFHPLDYKPERKIEHIPAGPFCVKCRIECKKTHQAGTNYSGESRWLCPKCKERFTGTHTKRGEMARIPDFDAADRRLNEIIAAGQKANDDALHHLPRTEAEDLCGCGKARNHRGICSKRAVAKPAVEEEPAPRLCVECGKATPGGLLCWDCDAAAVEGAKLEAGLAAVEGPTPSVEADLKYLSKRATIMTRVGGDAELEAPSSKEEPELKLALDPDEDDTGPVRLQMTDEASPVGDRGVKIEIRDDAPAPPWTDTPTEYPDSPLPVKMSVPFASEVSPVGDTPPPVEDMPLRWCSVHKRNEFKYESLEHELHASKAVSIDGGLRMNISINIDPGEMVKWGALRISNFWEGLAKALRAVNEE